MELYVWEKRSGTLWNFISGMTERTTVPRFSVSGLALVNEFAPKLSLVGIELVPFTLL